MNKSFLKHCITILIFIGSYIYGFPQDLPVCGTLLLKRNDGKNFKLYTRTIKAYIRKAPKLTYTVGQKENFYVYNFSTGSYETIKNVPCRAVGTHCYIFVPDQYYNDTYMQGDPDTIVQKIKNEFDSIIYPLATGWFGSPPDPGVDNDSKIFILITDIKDPGYGGGYVAGYFDSANETGYNKKEIITLDCNPQKVASEGFFETLIHEFQHMIHWNEGGGDEVRWVDEGCSTLAGYLYSGKIPQPHVSSFLSNPNISLCENRGDGFWFGDNAFSYYGASFLFMNYLREYLARNNQTEQQNIIKTIVSEKAKGIDGINKALSILGYSSTFKDIFKNWLITNIIDDNTTNWFYSENYDNNDQNDIPTPATATTLNPLFNGELIFKNSVINWGSLYIHLNNSVNNLTLYLNSASTTLKLIVLSKVNGTYQTNLITTSSITKFNISGTENFLIITAMGDDYSVLQGDTTGPDNPFYSFLITPYSRDDGFITAFPNPFFQNSIMLLVKTGNQNYEESLLIYDNKSIKLNLKEISSDSYIGSFTFTTKPSSFTLKVKLSGSYKSFTYSD